MYFLTRNARLALALSVISITACKGTQRATSPTMTGSLQVTVTSADGVTPSVKVTGPNAYNKTITSSQVITNLAIGDYNVAADSVAHADSVVGSIVDTVGLTGNPAAVQAADTAKVTVTYALERRTGALWVVNAYDSIIPEYTSAQLHASGAPAPAASVDMEATGPAGMALDAQSNLWESDFNTDTIFMYTPAARDSVTAAASAKLSSSAIQTAENVAIDSHGNLWLADDGGFVLEFTAAQLATAGAQNPTLQIVLPNSAEAVSLAFDASGNLWVGDDQNNHIVEYTTSQLTTSGPTCSNSPGWPQCSPAPADTIGSNANSISSPFGLAFDTKGNLWVANFTGTVVEFTPAQAALNGAPAPQVTLTTPSGGGPSGIAFDNSGSLWVADQFGADSGAVYGYKSTQLVTGSPTPTVAIASQNGKFSPGQLLFDAGATAQAPSAARVRGVQTVTRRTVARRGRMNPAIQHALERR